MLWNPQLANVSQGVPGYSKWHLGKIPFSQIFKSQIPVKFRKVFWATPDDILAICLALKSSACSFTASSVLGLPAQMSLRRVRLEDAPSRRKGQPSISSRSFSLLLSPLVPLLVFYFFLSVIFYSHMPMKSRKVFWATPNDILEKCHALKSSGSSCTASNALGLPRMTLTRVRLEGTPSQRTVYPLNPSKWFKAQQKEFLKDVWIHRTGSRKVKPNHIVPWG